MANLQQIEQVLSGYDLFADAPPGMPWPRRICQQGASGPMFPSRSSAAVAGTGTISQTLSAITGTGTRFTREVPVGAVLRSVLGVLAVVTVVTDDTHLTVNTSASVSDSAFSIAQ